MYEIKSKYSGNGREETNFVVGYYEFRYVERDDGADTLFEKGVSL